MATKTKENKETKKATEKKIPELNRDLYKKYKVTIKLREKLLGGIPRSGKLIEGWLASREMSDIEDKTKTEVDLVEDEKKAWTGFKTDDVGIYFETRCVKALIKEAASITGMYRQRRGLKQIFQHGMFVKAINDDKPPSDKFYFDHVIPARQDYIKEPDDHEEMCAHVIGPQGPRSILKRHDYVITPTLSFEIWVVDTDKKHRDLVDLDFLTFLLDYGQELGLGASRSQGFGKYDLVEIEEIR